MFMLTLTIIFMLTLNVTVLFSSKGGNLKKGCLLTTCKSLDLQFSIFADTTVAASLDFELGLDGKEVRVIYNCELCHRDWYWKWMQTTFSRETMSRADTA
jgi:hypothetical protein